MQKDEDKINSKPEELSDEDLKMCAGGFTSQAEHTKKSKRLFDSESMDDRPLG